ncbi:deoxynucleoside triphosphate triphosphohydrolase SAMHD1-like [Crassostrea virginica]
MKRKMSRKRTGVDNESGTLEKRQRLMPRREKGQSLSDHGKCPESPKSEASTSEKLRYDSMELFAKEGYEDVSNVLKDNGVTSKTLNKVTENQLKDLGISPLGRRLETVECIQKITERLFEGEILNDPIHGHITIHPLCVKIMDTPQFQRLRSIKQLGGAYFVYPSATHSRFEHSIGVYHLAGQLAESLKQRQPNLGISNTDILCVQIAGLRHDLGQGPFSHLFSQKFLPLARREEIKHEDLSLRMFEHLMDSNDLNSAFGQYGLTEIDRTFIKEQIGPQKPRSGEWPYKGRGQEKGFLYEIVANKRNGIDVDKWDYIARDCHRLGIKNNIDHERCIKYANVLEMDGELQICSRDKEAENFYDLLRTWDTQHGRAYQHRVGNIIETMITEALLKAKEIIEITGKNGSKCKLSDTVDDMEAYQKLTDFVFEQILWSSDEKLAESRKILMSIQTRQLYKIVGETQSSKEPKEAQIRNEVSKLLKKMKSDLSGEDIIIQVSHLLPDKCSEKLIRCYCKKRDESSIEHATKAFKEWREQHCCTEGSDWTMRPVKYYKDPVKASKTHQKRPWNKYF